MQHQRPLRLYLLISLLYCSFSTLASQNTTCYFPTGDEISDPADFYQACPTSFGGDNFRMCCKTDKSFNDVCETNGLCSRQHNPALGEDQGLLRSTCTDPSWTSPSCLKLCTTGIDLLGKQANHTEQYVRPCSDGSFCCEAEKPFLNSTSNATVDTCCEQGKGFIIQSNGKLSNVNPSGTSTPTAANSTSSSSHAPTPTPKSNTGAIVGGVVGGVMGLVIIVGAIWFFLRSRKRKMRAAQEEQTRMPPMEGTAGPNGARMSEMDAAGKVLPVEKSGNETFETDGYQVTEDRAGPHELR